MTQPEPEWLLAMHAPEDAADDESPIKLVKVRDLATAETERLARSVDLLSGLSERGAFLPLHLSAQQVNEQTQKVIAADEPFSRGAQEDLLALHMAVKQWLSNFRSYDDHTATWLSRQFGASSRPFRSFRSHLRSDYENNFAYRFCATLRNQSEHVGRVLNVIGGTPGMPGPTPFIGFDGPGLAIEFPDLKARVKRELSSLNHPLRLLPIVDAVMTSCLHSWEKLALSLEHEIREAVDQIRALHEEVATVGGQAAFVSAPPPTDPAGDYAFREVGLRFAELLDARLNGAEAYRGVEGYRVEPGDLV